MQTSKSIPVVTRAAKMTVLLGTNGTGKTTLLRHILESSGQRCLVITPDDVEWGDYPLTDLRTADDFKFDGICRHIFNPHKECGTLQRIAYFKQGIIVFDDCRAYLKSSTHDAIHELMIRRRQREVDIFAVGHGFNEVPPVFFTFSTEMILFRTTDNIVRRKNCLKDYEAALQAQQRINSQAKKEPHYFEIIKWE